MTQTPLETSDASSQDAFTSSAAVEIDSASWGCTEPKQLKAIGAAISQGYQGAENAVRNAVKGAGQAIGAALNRGPGE